MQLAKAVASAAAALVLKAKSVAQRTEDSGLQTQVIAAATQCALSTSQLVACTKVSPKGCPNLCHGVMLPPTREPHFISLAPETSLPNPVTIGNATNTPLHDSFPLPTSLTPSLPTGGGTYN